jgi:2,4-dienoyl-CoA reductase (NADPH2)
MEPLTLHAAGGITLKNRAVMGSMHTGLEENGFLFPSQLDDLAEYFAERARGGVGLMVTGGIAPNNAGRTFYGAAKMSSGAEAGYHKVVTERVHAEGGKIAMQILHTGRYGYHNFVVSASSIKSPIGWFTPAALSASGVEQTIADYVRCAELARSAGYDGVEIMGSEGYLINQFLVKKTNKRTDQWGGSYENRMRLATEIVKRTRQAVGKDFIIIYRLSMLDLVEDGSSWAEVVELAHRIEAAGASIINTGIGWHEARVPTIATMVPRGAYAWVTKKMRGEISIPLCTTNRINAPGTAEDILASGSADLVSMARPFLADPSFMKKAAEGRADEINTCIGCNQACLDHTFSGKHASCLVNPRAGHETSLKIEPVAAGRKQRLAVVGAGPAGLAFSTTAASRGHDVTLFEKDTKIGGQFNMAKLIPGKEEFYETLRYFQKQLTLTGVNVKLGTVATPETLKGFDAVVIATGVLPRYDPVVIALLKAWTDLFLTFSYPPLHLPER